MSLQYYIYRQRRQKGGLIFRPDLLTGALEKNRVSYTGTGSSKIFLNYFLLIGIFTQTIGEKS